MVDAQTERGSVLMLFPAAFLIMLVLGSLAIDTGAVFLRQRDLAAAAGAAANDAATLGLDLVELREGGIASLDPALVEVAVRRSLDRRGVLSDLVEPPAVSIVDDIAIEVTLVAEAKYVIAPALPNGPTGRTVRVTVRANAVLD